MTARGELNYLALYESLAHLAEKEKDPKVRHAFEMQYQFHTGVLPSERHAQREKLKMLCSLNGEDMVQKKLEFSDKV